MRNLDSSGQSDAQTLVRKLTAREHDVLALVGASLTNSEIAGRLFLTEVTVKGHMTSIMLKINARNRVDAALIAYRAGIVDA